MDKSVERAQKMIHDLLGSGLLMKDVIAGSGVNPTTLGWIRKGRAEKISSKTYSRIKDYWSDQVYSGNVSMKSSAGPLVSPKSTVPVLKGDRVDQAKQMVQQLVEKGYSVPQIYRDTEITRQTLYKLRDGKSLRVLDRTYDRLRKYWREVMNGKTMPGEESLTPETPVETPQKDVAVKTTKTPSRRQKRPETSYESFVSRQHVPVDVELFTTVIDRLIDRFEAAKKELEGIRKEMRS